VRIVKELMEIWPNKVYDSILKVIYLNIIDLMPSMLIYKHKVYQSKFIV